jgi:hypothetical protein
LPDARQAVATIPARAEETASFALFAGTWLLLCWPWLSGAVTIPWDAKAHFYPQLQFLAQSFHRGEWPFWAPFIFAGQPQIADPQSLVFSPPFLLLAALVPDPGFRAFDAVVFGMLGLGGLAVMALFRDRGWHPAGGLLAALAFAFGASAAWRVQHVGQVLSLSLWPVALWLLLRALERRSWRYGLAAGLAAGLMALGRDQVALLGLWLLAGAAAAFAVRSRPRLGAMVAPLTAGAIGGALVVAGPTLLTLLLAEGSNRPAIDYAGAARGAVHPALLLTSVIPNLFGVDGPFVDYWGPPSPRWGESPYVLARNMGVLYAGALPFALLLAGFFKGLLWAREIRPVTVGLALMLLYALGSATPVFWLAFELLPGVDFFRRPADALFLAGALAAIAAGYLMHRIWSGTFLSEGPPWGLAEILAAMAAFSAAMGLAYAKETTALAAWPLATAALWLALALLLLSALPGLIRRRPRMALALMVGALAADLAWNNGPNESTALPPSAYEVLLPASRNELLQILSERLGPGSLDRVELAGLGFHWPNASLVHRLHNTLGYNPLRLALYTRATGAEDHAALPDQRRFSPLFPSYRSTLPDLLGLRLIATGVPVETVDPRLGSGDLIPVARTPDGFVYENPRAFPRAFFVTEAAAADPETLLASGHWPGVDLRRTVLIEQTPPEGLRALPPSSRPAEVAIRSYRNTAVVIDVTTDGAGYLVLNDPYHPWWVAEIDGHETPILQANVLFRAVEVPSGAHRIRFVFRPILGAWRQAQRRWPGLAGLFP